MDRRISTEPFPPGDFIREAMEARNWTQDDLAEVMGRSRHTVLRLLNGQTAITPETAHELGKAFGSSAEVWMNLQTSYELAKAASDNREVERRSAIYSTYPVREMVKRNWISKTSSSDELEASLCRLRETNTLDEPINFLCAARKSGDYSQQSRVEDAWACQARKMARAVQAAPYDKRKLDAGIEELLRLAAYAEDVRRVPRVLADIGIRLVVVQHLPGTHIDGVAFFDDGRPVIALSTRYNRIDNFWFTLMHEIVHIKNEDVSCVDVDVVAGQRSNDIPEMERIANEGACNYLIPDDRLESFILRHAPRFSEVKISQFAQARKVHPGIVAGLLHGRGAMDFKWHRKLLVEIRNSLTENALTDGWGHPALTS